MERSESSYYQCPFCPFQCSLNQAEAQRKHFYRNHKNDGKTFKAKVAQSQSARNKKSKLKRKTIEKHAINQKKWNEKYYESNKKHKQYEKIDIPKNDYHDYAYQTINEIDSQQTNTLYQINYEINSKRTKVLLSSIYDEIKSQLTKNKTILDASNEHLSQNPSSNNTRTNNSHSELISTDFPFPNESSLEEITREASFCLKHTVYHTVEPLHIDDNSVDIEKLCPNICIFCDRYIIGTSKLNWISKDRILKHSSRISVDRWKTVTGLSSMNPILRGQYLFDEEGFENLLLSPRSRKNANNCYLCCSTCDGSLKDENIYSAPPKYSFANNFVIGTLPDDAWKVPNAATTEMNLLLPLMIAPIRPFYYLFCVQGGACKRMKGTITLFSSNQAQMHGSLEAIRERVQNLVFFLVFQGRLTHDQKHLARNKIKVDVDQYKDFCSG